MTRVAVIGAGPCGLSQLQAFRSAEKNGVEMPICHEVYQVLFNDKLPSRAIMELMQRELIDEHPE